MPVEDIQSNTMMSHLLDSLKRKKDIGQYGRLVFAMVGRHFLDEEELVGYLTKDPSMDEAAARALVQQVKSRDYSPPSRERILQWQEEQEFPLCPDADDPDTCNVYKDLRFPDEVYDGIQEYREQKAQTEN